MSETKTRVKFSRRDFETLNNAIDICESDLSATSEYKDRLSKQRDTQLRYLEVAREKLHKLRAETFKNHNPKTRRKS